MATSTVKQNDKAILYYVHDPMCSWCWGYRSTWQLLQQQLTKQLGEQVDIQYSLGGLAPDSNAPMPENMQQFLQQTWRKIANQLGTEFNFDFWHECQPKRSTYPACRAVLIAKEHGLEQEMIFAIQQAYYLQAKNPSEAHTLVSLAKAIGLNGEMFSTALASERINNRLMSEISQVRSLPINGFPSLVLFVDGQNIAITLDYQYWQTSFAQIKNALS
ncbi:DsbA family protein [Thalassotalea sp. PLHSN55]|uniref:DsbA family protein n=1 Tax=Thalassotalea sp. PLHSN55 TaxID=3435888 RepID=UPI003F827135